MLRISSLLHRVARLIEPREVAPAPAPTPPAAPVAPALPTMRASEQARVGAVGFGVRPSAPAATPAPRHSPLFGGHQFRRELSPDEGERTSPQTPPDGAIALTALTTDERTFKRLPDLTRAVALLDALKRKGNTHCTLFLVNEGARTTREAAERALRRLGGVARQGGDPGHMQTEGLYLGRADANVADAARDHANARASLARTLVVEVDLTGDEPKLSVCTRDLTR